MGSTDRGERLSDAEIAERLVAFLEEGSGGARSRNRRSERSTYFRQVQLILTELSGQPRLMGYTRNLSTGGLGLLTRRGFHLRERFAILLTLGGGSGRYALCQTTFCRYLSDGMYEVGATFVATAPCLNSNHRIPADWLGKAELIRVPVIEAPGDANSE